VDEVTDHCGTGRGGWDRRLSTGRRRQAPCSTSAAASDPGLKYAARHQQFSFFRLSRDAIGVPSLRVLHRPLTDPSWMKGHREERSDVAIAIPVD
jgi:hypothetical protein